MADKKLSSVDVVNDMAFIYAETSDGKTVKISKADLASVAAGLLPTAGISYSYVADTITINSPMRIPLSEYRSNLISIYYVYNKSHCNVIAHTVGTPNIILNTLPSPISLDIENGYLIISTSSGQYGLSVGTFVF